MPCRVDLFPVYEYYDRYDRINYLFFNTPLVPLTCEAMKILEENGLLKNCSKELQLWFDEHKKCDSNKDYKDGYREKEKVLEEFMEIEKKLTI